MDDPTKENKLAKVRHHNQQNQNRYQWKNEPAQFVLPLLNRIIQPLNVVQMWVWVCGQANLLDQIRTNQVVAANGVNHNARSLIVDDEESLEQIVALLLLGLLHLSAKDTLHNNGLVCHRVLGTEGGVLNVTLLIVHIGVIDLILNIGGADITSIVGGDVCTLARAILFHVTNSLALVTVNLRSAACGSDGRGTLGRHRYGCLATVGSVCGRCCHCGPCGH
jgi:hypothetical protein